MHRPCRTIHPLRTSTARNPKRANRPARAAIPVKAVPAKAVREKVAVREKALVKVVAREKVAQVMEKGAPCREREVHGAEKEDRMEKAKGYLGKKESNQGSGRAHEHKGS